MFKRLLVGVSAALLIGCGGASSDMAQFEPGLVGQYELVELHGDDFSLIHESGDARLGDMLLQDDNSFEQNFTFESGSELGYFSDAGDWSATLSVITFNDVRMGYDTSKPDSIGAEIGDLLFVDDYVNGFQYVWEKVTIAPRN